jgi:outer membrane receptor for Fe3+-dicitrate
VTDPANCGRSGLLANPNLSPGLVPFDLTRGGRLFAFHASQNINQFAAYIQDSITAGHFVFNIGFRADHYAGITSNNGAEPRAGIAYNIKHTGTVLRVAYARTFETPFNENLLLSSATGAGGLDQNVFGASAVPISPGRRNQFNGGLQQALGKYLLLDADYFWKYTHGAYDFSTLLNTTITFPISWHNSKLDGVTGRLSTTNLRGFQAYWTFGHTRARYFFPEVGGLITQGAPLSGSVFRIDHDQAFQSTGVFRYQHKNAEWATLTWRYDSGLAVSGVPDSDAALALTAAQQTSIGLACGGVPATFTQPITSCNGLVTSKLITLPQAGQENDDHNPDRVKPRHVFNLGLGTDNLFHAEGRKRITASLTIANLTNRVALYNFLSTFSGTHFLEPRSATLRVGLVF